MSRTMEKRRQEVYEEIALFVADTLRNHGIPNDVSDQCGHAAADHMAEHWGGQVISFSMRSAFRMSVRELQILAAKNAGLPVHQIAHDFDMSENGVRKLLSRVSRRNPIEQIELFDAPPKNQKAGV